jgi:uncharacterized membrane protein (DUF2068 family)
MHAYRQLKDFLMLAQGVLSLRLAVRRLLSYNKQTYIQRAPQSSPQPSGRPQQQGRIQTLDAHAVLGLREAANTLRNLTSSMSKDVSTGSERGTLSECFGRIPLSVIEEVSIADAIVQNETVCQALHAGLTIFGVQTPSQTESFDLQSLPHHVLQQFSVDTVLPSFLRIDESQLEKALELADTPVVARAHPQPNLESFSPALFTAEAKLLYKTAMFMRSLRLSIRLNHVNNVCILLEQCDMSVLADVVSERRPQKSPQFLSQTESQQRDYYEMTVSEKLSLHVCVASELYFFKHCLNLRVCVLNLRDCLLAGAGGWEHRHTQNQTQDLELAAQNLSYCLEYFKSVKLSNTAGVDRPEVGHAATEVDRLLKIGLSMIELRGLYANKQWEQYFARVSGQDFNSFTVAQMVQALKARCQTPHIPSNGIVCTVREELMHEWTHDELVSCSWTTFTVLCKRWLLTSLRAVIATKQSIPTSTPTQTVAHVDMNSVPALLTLNKMLSTAAGDVTSTPSSREVSDLSFYWLLENVNIKYEQFMSCERYVSFSDLSCFYLDHLFLV